MTDTPISAASKGLKDGATLRVAPTPFYLPQLSLCAANRWTEWNGFTVPSLYSSFEEEYEAVRFASGVSDMSPLARYRITGSDAISFVNRLVTTDMSRLSVGENLSSAMCNMRGGVIDLVDVLRVADEEFWLVSERPHVAWLDDSALGFDVRIDDMGANTAGLAISGPAAPDVLAEVGAVDADRLHESFSRIDKVADIPVRLVRKAGRCHPTFELWVRATDAEAIWSRLLHAKVAGLSRPVGQTILDVVRIEEGRLRAGCEFEPATRFQNPGQLRTPSDLGLGHLVDFDKCYFNGRHGLLQEQARFTLIGLDFADQRVGAGEALKRPGGVQKIGKILSATWSPTLKSYIAIAEAEIGAASLGAICEAQASTTHDREVSRYPAQGKVVALPFLGASQKD